MRSLICLSTLCFCTALGCGGSELSKGSLQEAMASFESAAALEQEAKHAEAIAVIDKSLASGGLNPDQLTEAYLIRSRCYSLTGKVDLAEQDVNSAEQGAPNPVSLHFAKAVLFAKKGMAAESKAEFSKALKINPKLKMPAI